MLIESVCVFIFQVSLLDCALFQYLIKHSLYFRVLFQVIYDLASMSMWTPYGLNEGCIDGFQVCLYAVSMTAPPVFGHIGHEWDLAEFYMGPSCVSYMSAM